MLVHNLAPILFLEMLELNFLIDQIFSLILFLENSGLVYLVDLNMCPTLNLVFSVQSVSLIDPLLLCLKNKE